MRHSAPSWPYATTVEIESFVVDGAMLRIGAVIFVERESQKPSSSQGRTRAARDRHEIADPDGADVRQQGLPRNWVRVRGAFRTTRRR